MNTVLIRCSTEGMTWGRSLELLHHPPSRYKKLLYNGQAEFRHPLPPLMDTRFVCTPCSGCKQLKRNYICAVVGPSAFSKE